jgi:hypothetical protein
VDQVTSLHDEKTAHFPNPTGFDPAIHGLSIASKNFRDLRDSQIFALWQSNFCCLPAHDRPAWSFGFIFYRRRVFERSGVHYRQLDARQKTRRTVGFSYIPDPQKVCNVQIWHAHFVNGMFQWIAIFNASFEIGVGSG